MDKTTTPTTGTVEVSALEKWTAEYLAEVRRARGAGGRKHHGLSMVEKTAEDILRFARSQARRVPRT